MVPDLYAVLNVLERHNSIADFLICGCRFSRWKEVFKYLRDPFAEGCVEILEDEMGI